MKFEIDFFELCFLAEACIPPQPIARSMFWHRFTYEVHEKLSKEQRRQVHEWLMKSERLQRSIEGGNEDAIMFEARYNPEKQYVVEAVDGNQYRTFLCKGRHYTEKDTFIPEENIRSAERV